MKQKCTDTSFFNTFLKPEIKTTLFNKWSTFLFLSFFPHNLLSIKIKFSGRKNWQKWSCWYCCWVILCFLFSLPSIWTQQMKIKSCGISTANKNSAGFHFLPSFLCFYIHISFRKCKEAMLITWTAVKCASLCTSCVNGCDSSPESLRHLRIQPF